MKGAVLLGLAVTIAAAIGIASSQTPSAATPAPDAAPPVQGPEAAPPHHPDTGSAGALEGIVRETIEVPQYTYLRLATTDGREIWAAVAKASVTVGSQVSIVDAAKMENFESASLKRIFEVIYFGNLGSPQAGSAHGGDLPPGHPPVGAMAGAAAPHGVPPTTAAPTDEPPVPIASGALGRTIAALYQQKEALRGATARVRGRIAKATPVQGVVYYRLRDGSSVDAREKELLVRSTATATPGDVVTFEGVVQLDVDVGIGTLYPVLLDSAKLVGE